MCSSLQIHEVASGMGWLLMTNDARRPEPPKSSSTWNGPSLTVLSAESCPPPGQASDDPRHPAPPRPTPGYRSDPALQAGISSYVAFDAAPQVSLEDMLAGQTPQMASYDESVLSYGAFKVREDEPAAG